MRNHPLIVLLLLILGSAAMTTSAVAGTQYDYASVGISPAYQEIEQGGTTTLTVVGQSTLGGMVYANLPPGLDLVGTPNCTSGCRVPFVTNQTDGTRIDFTIDGEIATVSFTVVVGPSTPVGTILNVNAYLVGGPNAVEMSSAIIAIVEAAPTPVPPPNQQPSGDVLGDNRMAYLEVSPPSLRMAPGGEALYRVQPVRWGMWADQAPRIDVVISVPDGLTLSSEPSCGRGDVAPALGPCEAMESTGDDGGTTWSIAPGYSASDGAANGVYMMLRADEDVEHETSLRVSVSATVDDDSLAEQPAEIASSILVVEPASLLTAQAGSESVGAVLEITHGFTASGSSCSAEGSSPTVGLWEFGVATMFATTSPGPGVLGMATDGSGSEVCLVPVQFTGVPARDLYVLATYDGLDSPCRACVYGTVTTSRGAEAVFPARG